MKINVDLYLNEEELKKFRQDSDCYGCGDDAFASFVMTEYLQYIELEDEESEDE